MKPLKADTYIEIIAPAGKIPLPAGFEIIEKKLNTWGYRARFGRYLLGNHPFLANTTERRFEDIKSALYAPDSEAIWCYRGGNGSAELLPLLDALSPLPSPKLFLGFSDITALHIFFQQRWGWTTYHGPCASQIGTDKLDIASEDRVEKFFKHHLLSDITDLIPLNTAAQKLSNITGIMTGGNLSIIAHSLGTPYQINAQDKILLLEDVNEPAYKIRRMLTQLRQANIFDNLKAIILGQFIQDDTIQNQWIENELHEFANTQYCPVFRTNLIGHGKTNYIIPMGKPITTYTRHM